MILSNSLLRFWERSSHPIYDLLSQEHWLANEEAGEISLSELSSSVSKDTRLGEAETLSQSYQEVGLARGFAEGLVNELGIKTEAASRARRGEVSPLDPRVSTISTYFIGLIDGIIHAKPIFYPELPSNQHHYPKKADIELAFRPGAISPLSSSFGFKEVLSGQIERLNTLLSPPLRYPGDQDESSEEEAANFPFEVVRITSVNQRHGVIFYSVECADGQIHEATEESLDQVMVDMYWEERQMTEDGAVMGEDLFDDHLGA